MSQSDNTINWAQLNHAYGSAEDTPILIKDLNSPHERTWSQALEQLSISLCHQECTVYEATVPAVPLLITLLERPEVRCRAHILVLLGDIARAGPALSPRDAPNVDDEDRTLEEFQQQLEQAQRWAHESHEAVWDGLQVYLSLLAHSDRTIRMAVPYTLGRLVAYAGMALPAALHQHEVQRLIWSRVHERFAAEADDLVRCSLLFAIRCLAPAVSEAGQLLEQVLGDPGASSQLRFSAAYCLAALSSTPPAAAVQTLVDALQQPAETDHLFERGTRPRSDRFRFPWLDMRITLLAVEQLGKLDPAVSQLALPALLTFIDHASPGVVDMVFGAILTMVFDSQRVTPDTAAEHLTLAQRQVLHRIYGNPLVWATDIANVAFVFDRFGLPRERTAWARLLGIEERVLSDAEIDVLLQRLAPAQQYGMSTGITRLNLRQIGTPAFLPHLRQFPDLEALDLSGIPIEDQDIVHLLAFPRLKNLQLPGSRITDSGAILLPQLTQLEDLNLSRSAITDQGLLALVQLERLSRLFISHVTVSDEALRLFAQARPRCRVYHR